MTSRFVLVLFLVAAVCDAQDVDIVTKTIDRAAGNGKPDRRDEITYRGKTPILMVYSEKRPSGDYVPYTRTYMVGHTFVVETDRSHQGFFDTIIIQPDLYDPRTIEAFSRDCSGNVRPLAREKLEKIKEDYAASSEALSGTSPFQNESSSNRSMKPTAPLRNKFSVFAMTPCRGLPQPLLQNGWVQASLSR
jgi:hypothetical protein